MRISKPLVHQWKHQSLPHVQARTRLHVCEEIRVGNGRVRFEGKELPFYIAADGANSPNPITVQVADVDSVFNLVSVTFLAKRLVSESWR